MVDWELLKKLINTVKEEDISGLSIEEKGVKYEIKRDLLTGNLSHVAQAYQPPTQTVPSTAVPVEEGAKEEDGIVAITSPMVGTFYRSPSPESPPFVDVGDEIEPGKVVCIVEAMKLFNEIESEVRGKIIKVLAENGKPVEYGQKLYLIKKA